MVAFPNTPQEQLKRNYGCDSNIKEGNLVQGYLILLEVEYKSVVAPMFLYIQELNEAYPKKQLHHNLRFQHIVYLIT